MEKIKRSETREVICVNKQKLCLFICIGINLGILAFFKYISFAAQCINDILSIFSVTPPLAWKYNILLPVGISFYTLQALGYLIDVYRDDICAEKNFIQYALFVSFFPQLVAGPIERSKNLLTQLKNPSPLKYENLRRGFYLILYGLFLKMVIADRAAVIVDTVFQDTGNYPGFYILFAVFIFSIQIYCDFHGYSTIARGSSLMMGISLMTNFESPYYSRSVKEFWRKWHISLSSWFRDYLYIPLGGSKKGRFRKELNLMIIFSISGLWHGASWGYVLWGALNGAYQIVSDLVKILKEKLFKIFHLTEAKNITFCRNLLQTIITFHLISFAWLFFRAGSLTTSLSVLKDMFSKNNYYILFNHSLLQVGLTAAETKVLFLSIAVLAVVDYLKYKKRDVMDLFLRQEGWFRYIVFASLFFVILIYGYYGDTYDAQQFIYFQF